MSERRELERDADARELQSDADARELQRDACMSLRCLREFERDAKIRKHINGMG
jgi:hypothetical protein